MAAEMRLRAHRRSASLRSRQVFASGGMKASGEMAIKKPLLRGTQSYLHRTETLIYTLRHAGDLYYIGSDRTLLTRDEADDRYGIVALPTRTPRFSWEVASAFLRGQVAIEPRRLFEQLVTLFVHHSRWTSPHTPAVLAAWVMATYIHQAFEPFPYLIINVHDRAAATGAMMVLAEVAFNATPPATRFTPAMVFHDSHFNTGVQLIGNPQELIRNADAHAAFMIGFDSRDSIIARCKPGRGTIEYYPYAPRVFATTRELPDRLRDRSFNVRCTEADDTIIRQLRGVRDQLHVFALMNATEIERHYRAYLSHTSQLPDTDSRGREMLSTLFAVAHVVGDDALRALSCAAEEVVVQRRAEDEREQVARAREELVATLGWSRQRVLDTAEAFRFFRKAHLLGATASEDDAQTLLHRLGLQHKRFRVSGRTVSGYRIDRAALASNDAPGSR
jgi:hypothetical protein